MSITLTVGENQRRIEVAFDSLETVLYFSSLKREISVAELKHFYLFFNNVLEEFSSAIPSLGPAPPRTAKDDPAHDEIGHLRGELE
jgi:hypothetical protein